MYIGPTSSFLEVKGSSSLKTTSIPKLPFSISRIPSNRDHRGLNRSSLGSPGTSAPSESPSSHRSSLWVQDASNSSLVPSLGPRRPDKPWNPSYISNGLLLLGPIRIRAQEPITWATGLLGNHKDPAAHDFWYLLYIGPWNQNVRSSCLCGPFGPLLWCLL